MRSLQASAERLRSAGRAQCRILTLAFLALLALGAAAPAEAAALRAASHDGYGRLVFDQDRAGGFQAVIEGDRLVVRFDQPFSGKLDAALRALDGYIANPTLSADRKTASFALKRPVALRSFSNERSAVIDLLDEATAAAPAADRAAEPPAPAKTASDAVATKASASTAPAPVKTQVAAPLREQAAAAEPPPAAMAAPDKPAQPVAVRIGQHADFTRLVFEWPGSVNYRVNSDGPVTRLDFDRAGSIDVERVKKSLPRAIGNFDVASGAGTLSVAMAIPAKATVRHFRNGNSIVLDVLAPPGAAPAAVEMAASASAPAPVLEAAKPAAPAAEGAKAAATAAQPAPAAPQVAIAAEPAKEAIELGGSEPAQPARAPRAYDGPVPTISFTGSATPQAVTIGLPWKPAPAAAIYERGGYIYMVFDRPAAFDFAALRRLGNRIGAPEQLALAEGAALRFQIGAGYGVRVARNGDGWTLTLRADSLRPDIELPVTVDGASGAVAIGIAGALSPVSLPDPELGDTLLVVPVELPGRGIAARRNYARFSVLPSIQGIVVAPRGDGVLVRPEANRVMIGTASALAGAPSTIAPGTAKFFEFGRWLQRDVDFTETKQMLERNSSEADAANRAGARFMLAQFYLARDHAVDTLGILDLIVDGQPELSRDPAVRALRGAARVALRHGTEALPDLNDPRLDRIETIQLWRAVALAQTGDWSKANDLFKQTQAIPADYPPELQWNFALAAAEAAVVTGEVQRAYRLLEPLARRDLPVSTRNRAEYLRARALLAAEDVRSALPLLERLISDGDPWARAHAEAIWVEQALKSGKINRREAIRRLERSRYAWTGDELEFANLRRLAQLYLEEGNPREAFERYRSAITFFAYRPEVPEVQKEMVDAFVGLYVGPSAEKLPPLTALSLYDDYRDLTPPGPRGDEMIQHLADRLVQIDLLDRAAELLDYQIRNRLAGTEKSRIGMRLAIVDLLDHNPQGALDALEASELANLPPDIALERQRLRARALLDLGFADKALAALSDSSRETDLLRAEIHSRGQRWMQAAQVLWRVVGAAEDKSLDAGRSRAILNLGIALVLSADRDGVRKLDAAFGPPMSKGPDAEAYAVLTRGMADPVKGVDVAALSQRFTQLTQFQTAMDRYRIKLRNSGLSTVN